MANYKTRRRPLSCEVHLSVIQEEELESLRKRREWMDNEKHKSRRSKSESDGDICEREDNDNNIEKLEDEVMEGPQPLHDNDDSSPNDVFGSPVDGGGGGAASVSKKAGSSDDISSYYEHLEPSWETHRLRALSLDRHNSIPLAFTQYPFDADMSLLPTEGPRSMLRKTNSLDQIKPKGNKYIRRAMPFLSRMTSNLKRAVSEKDLLKLTDFSVATSMSPSPRTSPTPRSPTLRSPTVRSPTVRSPTPRSPTLRSPTVRSPTVRSPTARSPTPRSPTGQLESAGSPGPSSRRNSNCLRQCDSLENVCDAASDDQLENGLGLAAQPAASNAFSLPHINQLSDYEDDNTATTTTTSTTTTTTSSSSTTTIQHYDPVIDHQPEHDFQPPKTTNKRADKSKKTKLKRRRAYYRTPKDGRSKSLTHIDTLEDSGMLLSGEEMEGREGPTDKLGVPDPHSLRRRKLSLATKVSSCEYMALVLECFVDPVEEFVQASRGTTLREALERRGVDVSSVHVYTEGSRSPLPLSTDTYVLGGKTIRVRARDESRSPVRSRSAGTPGAQPHRKVSSSHRGGQGRFPWGGASTEDCSPLGDDRTNGGAPTSHEGSLKAAKSNKQNNRWSSIFPSNTKDSKMDSLVQQLDMYSKQGIPLQPHLLASQTPGNDDEVVVEDSWRTLVEGHEQLDERQEQQQSAIWELVETEATYIHMLKVITDLFLACLCNLQNESLLFEVDTDKLFSNIQEIYCANLTFWREHVVRMLEASRSSRQPLDPTLLTEAFYKFDELFHPYTRYCLEQSNCQLYCKEKDHDNEYFKMYLAWCETQKECNRLRLVDILVQPMQRLTKYSLLLKAILKKTTLEHHKLCLHDMITHVENFVSNVNSALRHKHEQERLRDIAKRIEAYEAVEARDDELERVVRNYSDLNLTQPMPGCPEHLPRHLLHHGDLRLRDPHTSKMDVHVFLFTDLLLITKITQRKAEKVKIVRPPYHVERLVLVELKDSTSIGLVSVNEWNVAVAAFTLQCPDQRTHRTWHDTLKRAKEQYKEAQQTQDVMVYDEMTCVGHLVPRSPRPGSSRASRVSSLVHSHSGSIDLNESSPATQHHPSIDMSDVRASSASSDDSVAQPAPEIQRSRSLEGGGCGAISPRPDRRPGYPKTPNTLSVTPPYATGQSLPNLTVESANSLRVPGTNGSNPKALSPCTRGVSYPPPSPRTLRRSAPVPQSRNPPLIKTRHVTSMIGSPQDVDQGEQDDTRGQRRTYRIDRMDNRRYHTAGAIDDIKKQDAKDATIHKRLSWNYGQGPPPSRDLGNDQGKLGRHKHAVKNVSCESVHSSSGVSSTSSLHRSMGSEVEALENIDDNELEDGEATVVDLTVSDCTSLKISPHISTTYICHDSDITLGVCSQYITQPNSSPEPSEGCENLVKIDVSETDPGISSVQITVTEGATSSSSSNLSSTTSPESAPAKPDNTRMREILLNDASVEASDV